MSGDRLIPDLANDPPPEREDEPTGERPRPERPPTPWDRPPKDSRGPPPPPPTALPPPTAPRPLAEPEPPFPYAAQAAEKRAEGRDEAPYASRFQLILGVLLGIAAVAIVAALLAGSGPKDKGTPNWSGWKPDTKNRGDAAQEIANHVAPTYRLDAGGQLVAVKGGDLQFADLPVRPALADPSSGNVAVLGGKGVLYTLCGLGPKCSINTGKPSAQRHLLLRREALEMALYTFRYVKGTAYVVALLPPKKGKDATQALFFTKGDVEGELNRPLTRTLPSPPPTSEGLNQADISTLQSLTDKSLFAFKFAPGQDASVFLVLQPLAG